MTHAEGLRDGMVFGIAFGALAMDTFQVDVETVFIGAVVLAVGSTFLWTIAGHLARATHE